MTFVVFFGLFVLFFDIKIQICLGLFIKLQERILTAILEFENILKFRNIVTYQWLPPNFLGEVRAHLAG